MNFIFVILKNAISNILNYFGWVHLTSIEFKSFTILTHRQFSFHCIDIKFPKYVRRNNKLININFRLFSKYR